MWIKIFMKHFDYSFVEDKREQAKWLLSNDALGKKLRYVVETNLNSEAK